MRRIPGYYASGERHTISYRETPKQSDHYKINSPKDYFNQSALNQSDESYEIFQNTLKHSQGINKISLGEYIKTDTVTMEKGSKPQQVYGAEDIKQAQDDMRRMDAMMQTNLDDMLANWDAFFFPKKTYAIRNLRSYKNLCPKHRKKCIVAAGAQWVPS